MKVASAIAAAVVAATLLLPRWSAAQDGEYSTVAGKIESIDRDGKLRVDGKWFAVDMDTEVTDQLSRQASRKELQPGLDVEITYEQAPGGLHARSVVATMMR